MKTLAQSSQELLYSLVKDELNYFHDFSRFINLTIKKRRRYLEEEHERLKKEVESESFKALEDHFGSLRFQSDRFEHLLYKSFLVSILSFLEQELSFLCDNVHSWKKCAFSYKDLRGNGIKRIIDYLEKVLNVAFPSNKKLKDYLETAIIIRNAIVHNGSVIPENHVTKVINYKKNNPGEIDLLLNGVIFEIKYAEKTIQSVEEIIKNINYLKSTISN